MEVLTSLAVIFSGCRVAQCSPFRYLQCNEGSTPREEARRACSWVCPFLEIPASDWPAQAPECAWSCVFDELCVLGASLVAQWQAACQWGSCGFDSWVGKVPWRKWPPIPIFLLGKSHEQRSLGGYCPWGFIRVGHDLVTKQQQKATFSPGLVTSHSWHRRKRWWNSSFSTLICQRSILESEPCHLSPGWMWTLQLSSVSSCLVI